MNKPVRRGKWNFSKSRCGAHVGQRWCLRRGYVSQKLLDSTGHDMSFMVGFDACRWERIRSVVECRCQQTNLGVEVSVVLDSVGRASEGHVNVRGSPGEEAPL